MRKPIIAGNWKMNKTMAETEAFVKELAPLVKNAECDVVLCVPYTDIVTAAKATANTNIKVGAENVAWADNGAFTGEISAEMLKEAGAEYVVIGHSERRQYFGETDETVNKRLVQALKYELKPIVCVGETLEEREGDKTEAVLTTQLTKGYANISADDAAKTVIAYEPVWAIGTGKTATDEQAEETIKFIRTFLAELYGASVADGVRIQYGGSMKPSNAKSLMAQPDIDGGLIGGASLVPADFTKVVLYNE